MKVETTQQRIHAFIEELSRVAEPPAEAAFPFHNLYRQSVTRQNLELYLMEFAAHPPEAMLVSQSPLHQGGNRTGVPFTDALQLQNPANAFLLGDIGRYAMTQPGADKASADLWEGLRANHLRALVWDVFPFHPYKAGIENSDRAPTQAELRMGSHFAKELQDIFAIPPEKVWALGKKSFGSMGLPKGHYIRHPAFGGREDFLAGLAHVRQVLDGAELLPPKDRYLIGDVAEMFGISIDTLRYYEKEGLVTASRADNDYRYYNLDQTSNLNNIVLLRTLGVPMSQLKELATTNDLSLYLKSIETASAELEVQLRILQRTQKRARTYMELLRRAGTEKNRVQLRQCPDLWIAKSSNQNFIQDSIRAYTRVQNTTDTFPQYIFFTLPEEALADPIVYHKYGIAEEQPFELMNLEVEKQPACTCAYLLFEGPYSSLGAAYRQLLDWVKENGYEVAGDLMESYILSNLSVYLMELWCPIRPAQEESVT